MDGAMVTAMTRTQVQSTANTSGQQTSKRTLSRGFATQQSGVGSPSLYRGLVSTLIRNEQLAHQVLGQVGTGGGYAWMLVDSDNRLWSSVDLFAAPTSTSTLLPVPSTLWSVLTGSGYMYEAVFTGQYWFLYDQTNKRFLRGSPDLSTWTVVTGISLGIYYGIVALGLGSTVYIAGYGAVNTSTDGGLTWTTKSIPFLYHMDMLYSDGALLVVGVNPANQSQSLLFTSTDDFTTYTTTTIPTAVYTLTKYGSTLYATGRNTILSSTNNGATWVSTSAAGAGVIDTVVSTGSYFVTNMLSGSAGPCWSTSIAGPWTRPTTTDGSTIRTFDFVRRNLYFNGTQFVYRDHTNNQVFISSDGKAWRQSVHPVIGKKFVAAFPRGRRF